jgi:2-desacetyl-2-hydroxyethyl bacteriochlorophyllide A dehydrogenase
MLALVKYGFGKGETEIREVGVPEVGGEDILIEVKAAGICGSDIAYDNGEHPEHLRPPVILGHEFAGIVASVGEDVTDWKVGDRIVSDNTGYVCGKCYACSTADYLSCPERLGLGYSMDGGFTQYVKISGDLLRKNPNCVFRIPDSISFEEAAILDPFCNAYKAVVQESNLLPGGDIAVFGVGPLGLCSVQMARIAGAARIIVVARSSSKGRLQTALDLGATHIILGDKEDVEDRIREITKGEYVDLVVDCAGANEVIKSSVDILRKGGEIIKVGFDSNAYNLSLDSIVNKGINIKGHFGYDYTSWRNCIKLIEAGKLDIASMITHELPLTKWKEGFELMRSKKAIKVILTYK